MNPTPSILIVDDEPDLLDNISLTLEAEDYQVFSATDGRAALALLEDHPVDLILADIAMPEMNGYQLYERVRERSAWAAIPFIFLTARTMDSDIRYGKELGVDDYLTKPIRAGDLLAVVRGKLRRSQQLKESLEQFNAGPPEQSRPFTFGRLQIDPLQHRIQVEGEEISLSAKEFALLEHLARQGGRVASPQELIQTTHEFDANPVEAGQLLRPLILSLRRKLGLAEGEVGSIENVRGVGYRLVVPDPS